MQRLAYAVAAGLALAVVLGGLGIAAATPAADEPTIKQLIADLGNKEASVRSAAQKRLIEIGLPSRPALLVAAKSDDPEVRTRALAALKDLQEVTVKDLGRSPARAGDLVISPDGRHVAFQIGRNGKEVLVCDGQEGPEWDQITVAITPGVSPFSATARWPIGPRRA